MAYGDEEFSGVCVGGPLDGKWVKGGCKAMGVPVPGRTGWDSFGYYWLAGAWLPESDEQAQCRMAEAKAARRAQEER